MRNGLLEAIRKFNSKERFFLVGYVLGNTRFSVSSQFRTALSNRLNVPIPDDLFCAMDYHLDWLYAALQVSTDSNKEAIYNNGNGIIKANQEDIDLLLAYEGQDGCHLILVEAKATTGWNNKQMKSKAERLKKIFGEDGSKWAGVTPHFVLMSPGRPQCLITSDCPSWMVPGEKWLWMRLEIPDDLNRVTRCDSDGKPCDGGTFWKVAKR